MSRLWVIALLASAISLSMLFLHSSRNPGAGRLDKLPKVILWAWERPEDLRFIDVHEAGVAFLVKTIYLDGNRVEERPRLQPLRVPDHTSLLGVVRIETRHLSPVPDSLMTRKVTAEILQVARMAGLTAIQVDFDAVRSERAFYAGLIRDIRRGLPDSMGLSVTALASWCYDDRWLDGLPLDEAVPMLFRMGVDHDRIVRRLLDRREFSLSVCRKSVGISTDETLPYIPPNRRTYVFNPRSWSLESYTQVMKKAGQQ